MPNSVVGRAPILARRCNTRPHIHEVDVGGNIVNRVRPRIREERLQTMRKAMANLRL